MYNGLIQAEEVICSRAEISPSSHQPHGGIVLNAEAGTSYNSDMLVHTALFSFLSRLSSALQHAYWMHTPRYTCIQKLRNSQGGHVPRLPKSLGTISAMILKTLAAGSLLAFGFLLPPY